MPKILLDGNIQDDTWTKVDDEAALPAGPVAVSHARWVAEKDALKARGQLAVCLPNDLDADTLAEDIAAFDAIFLTFPDFNDGRAYSQARVIRDRLGFSGEIRAMGDVLQDQAFYMQRCGFNSFEPNNQNLDALLEGFQDFSQPYQGGATDKQQVFERRRA